ncbi:MAG: sulfatase [Thermoguttaceae bacterium]
MKALLLLMLTAGMGLGLPGGTAACPATPQPAKHKPPNIILILADDLGWSDLACYGSDLHETPHLDKLAKQGVRFTDAYAAFPVCSPTRAAILTGKHPAWLGITIWREGALNPPRNRKLLPAAAVADLPHSETTLATTLQSAGYLTALVGKWHLGDADHAPETHGFDVNIGGTHWGAPATYFFPYRGAFGQAKERRYIPHLEFGKPGEYLTDRLTEEALRVIDRAAEMKRPFFLYLAHHAPHTPIEAKPELVKHYEKKINPKSRHRNPAYAAMVHSLDESVGRIVERIENLGLAERTVIVFTSDNGGHVGEYQGKNVTNNAPLRSGKGSLYEGGLRVPLIVRWSGVTPAGAVCGEPVVSMDLYWTILDITGCKVAEPPKEERDGQSLVPQLKDPKACLEREALFFHYPHYYPTTTPVSAVRRGDWKLLEYHEDNRVELYNLKDDPGETQNLAAERNDQANELLRDLRAWRKRVNARMPTPNPDFRPKGTNSPPSPST